MKKRIFAGVLAAALSVLLAASAALTLLEGAWAAAAMTVILAASVWLALVIAERIARSLRELDPADSEKLAHYPELSALLRKIGRQDDLILRQMNDIRRHREEFRAITENMQEGFILVDRKMEMLSFNHSALRLLGESAPESVDLRLRHSELISEALAGHRGEKTVVTDTTACQIIASPIRGAEDELPYGAVIVILDITETRLREQMRREFTSNVSHELKTPLTSIYGISEMLTGNLVKPEDVPRFAETIHRESGRLISLVADIIKLSQLDEESVPTPREEVDLYEIAAAVTDRMQPAAAEAGVKITLRGGSRTLSGIPAILTEIVSNLCDNAVKYNRPGGSVYVTVDGEEHHPRLTVSDTGIGIPPEDQTRVFERFYRVDKSHSRAIGGTGLGLSIVKHGAAYHGAEVSLTSAPGIGTEITVRF